MGTHKKKTLKKLSLSVNRWKSYIPQKSVMQSISCTYVCHALPLDTHTVGAKMRQSYHHHLQNSDFFNPQGI